jgi:hypothetical protein
MQRRWTTVFSGPMSEALVCQGLLDSNGLATHLLDQNIKVIDPFITGANAFDVQLQVPAEDVRAAKEMLAWRPDDDREIVAAIEPAEERVRRLGKRIRWASIQMFTAPYVLCLAWPYFRGVKQLGRRPEDYAWTIAALGFSLVTLATILGIVLRVGR